MLKQEKERVTQELQQYGTLLKESGVCGYDFYVRVKWEQFEEEASMPANARGEVCGAKSGRTGGTLCIEGKCILKPRAYFGVCTPDFSNMTSIGDITQSPEFMYRGKCILKPRAYFGVCTPDFSNMTSIGDITQSPEEMEKVECEPCKTRDKKHESTHWCVFCEESFCSDCTENHHAQKISRDHELVDINRKPMHTNIANQCCFKHENLPFEYFCIDHDVLSCKECLAESHRSCHKVVSVDAVSKGAKQSQSFIDALELVGELVETTHTIVIDRESFIENFEKEANSVKNAIRELKKEAISHIESLEKSLLSDLDLKKDKIMQKSKTTIIEAEDVGKIAKDKKVVFDLVDKHGSEKQAFLFAHAYTQDLTDLKKKITGMTGQSTNATIKLTPERLQETIQSIGSIELNEVPSALTPCEKPKNLPQFVHKSDFIIKDDHASVNGITVNDNDEVLIVDGTRTGGILVYDNNDIFKYRIDTKYRPWDIAFISSINEAVVTSHHDDFLQFVDFKEKSISRTVTVEGIHQGGVAVSNENIFVGTRGNIKILDLQGKFIRLIEAHHRKLTWFITLDKTGNIYYTDREVLSCIRSDGTEVYTYSAPDDDTLWQLAVDNNGYVYVCVDSKGIYRLKPDGTFLDVVESYEESLSYTAICFNNACTKMVLYRCSSFSVFEQK
ncbi:Hypothetical predicted protein [Mytilus galloprovincialis]|nr:Hypothetical predicted protein [Mytilus galloprovincialis]